MDAMHDGETRLTIYLNLFLLRGSRSLSRHAQGGVEMEREDIAEE
jgi:hypothetical protein